MSILLLPRSNRLLRRLILGLSTGTQMEGCDKISTFNLRTETSTLVVVNGARRRRRHSRRKGVLSLVTRSRARARARVIPMQDTLVRVRTTQAAGTQILLRSIRSSKALTSGISKFQDRVILGSRILVSGIPRTRAMVSTRALLG